MSSTTPTAMFPAQTDPEHILGRGFEINLSTTDLTIVEPEASTPPPIVLRSFWGKATLAARTHWPYDFKPIVFSGIQLWDNRNLPLPRAVVSAFPEDAFGRGVGSYMALDEFPDRYDPMEFVLQRRTNLSEEKLLPEVCMAWVILDTRPVDLDPFVVAATRVLEPLIAELRRSVEKTNSVQLRVPASSTRGSKNWPLQSGTSRPSPHGCGPSPRRWGYRSDRPKHCRQPTRPAG